MCLRATPGHFGSRESVVRFLLTEYDAINKIIADLKLYVARCRGLCVWDDALCARLRLRLCAYGFPVALRYKAATVEAAVKLGHTVPTTDSVGGENQVFITATPHSEHIGTRLGFIQYVASSFAAVLSVPCFAFVPLPSLSGVYVFICMCLCVLCVCMLRQVPAQRGHCAPKHCPSDDAVGGVRREQRDRCGA